MRSDPNQRRARTEPDREASPSGGWRAVYATMGVSPDGDAQAAEIPERRERSTERDGDPAEADSGRGVAARS